MSQSGEIGSGMIVTLLSPASGSRKFLNRLFTVTCLMSSNIGVGFVFLPSALAQSGWVLGLLGFGMIAGLQFLAEEALVNTAYFEKETSYFGILSTWAGESKVRFHTSMVFVISINFVVGLCFFHFFYQLVLQFFAFFGNCKGISLAAFLSSLTSEPPDFHLDVCRRGDSRSHPHEAELPVSETPLVHRAGPDAGLHALHPLSILRHSDRRDKLR